MRISTVKRNIAANAIGNVWAAAIAIAFVPLYIRFLGIEAWGIVGVFTLLQSLCVVLDLGLSAALNREMARLSIRPGAAQAMRDLLRTMEVIYWGFAVLIGVSVSCLAPWIAGHWVQPQQLSPQVIRQAIRIMGLAVALQWPFGLYSGGLLGLQRQQILSSLTAGLATVRALGATLILWKVSHSLEAFFAWQVVISSSQTFLACALLWRSLPTAAGRSRFQLGLLRQTWRFSAAMTAITITSLLLTQMDKVLLSRLLTLEAFGYYVLAAAVAASLSVIVQPVFYAVYPRLTQLVSIGEDIDIRCLYHRSCQFLSSLVLPVTVVIALFSKEILLLWTKNPVTAANTHLLLSVLVIGAGLIGIAHIPYALQLAYGWTRLALGFNSALVLTLTPSMVVMTRLYGALGAATISVALGGTFALVGIQLMHRRLLRGEQWKWYRQDVGLPLVASLVTGTFCRALLPNGIGGPQLFLYLVGSTLLIIFVTMLATPVTRAWFAEYFRSRTGRLVY